MALITITKANGTSVALPDPSEFQFDVQDIDGSTAGRNQSGYMFRDRVAVKIKVECAWNNIKNAAAQTILNAITDQFFTVTCPDPRTGSNVSFTAYCGDRTLPAYNLRTGKWVWQNLAVNFIER
jgi:hypothetical protein